MQIRRQTDASPLDQLQHIAFNVHPDASLADLQAKLVQGGLHVTTPILDYSDDNGAGLSQLFSIPTGYFFYEFVQRRAGAKNEPFSGFDPAIIDDVYEALDASLSEARKINAQWVPDHVYFVDGT